MTRSKEGMILMYAGMRKEIADLFKKRSDLKNEIAETDAKIKTARKRIIMIKDSMNDKDRYETGKEVS